MNKEADVLEAYLADCRTQTMEEILRVLPSDHRYTGGLYQLMLEYPLRPAKGLRPALCIATARALGLPLAAILPSAAVLELYHNAFLIHDDVEDGSEMRRAGNTLHQEFGVPIAVNVGDGMLAVCMRPLLDNIEYVGLGRSLRVLEVIARMCRESAEGQMMELRWIGDSKCLPRRSDYVRMVYKKTSWYSFIAPVVVGALCAGAPLALLSSLSRFAGLLGIAFQIQDDVLNLRRSEAAYGKEECGDLWEGKITLPLLHALDHSALADQRQMLKILARARPKAGDSRRFREEVHELQRAGELSERGARKLYAVLESHAGAPTKTAEDIEFLRTRIEESGGVEAAWQRAERYAARAASALARSARELPDSPHTHFLTSLSNYTVSRTR